jgi:hypothetical protein
MIGAFFLELMGDLVRPEAKAAPVPQRRHTDAIDVDARVVDDQATPAPQPGASQ